MPACSSGVPVCSDRTDADRGTPRRHRVNLGHAGVRAAQRRGYRACAAGYGSRMTEIPPSEVPEESEQLDQTPEGDRLDPHGPEDVLDEGYSPPEKWSAAQRFGNTHLEEEIGETLDQRVAQEEP